MCILKPSIQGRFTNMCKVKIFVPLGTQRFPFSRLIVALNSLVEKGLYQKDEIVMQSSVYPVMPIFKHVSLIPYEEFNKFIDEAEVVVTHSGVNSIISCMEREKPLVICPRLSKYKEHVDDHQNEIANLMRDKYDVLVCRNMHDLSSFIDLARIHRYKPWVSHKDGLLSALRTLII